MFTMVFRGQAGNGERIRRRIRRNLEPRVCMRMDELCLRLGEPEALVQAELESLVRHGDVEKIRPFRCERPGLAAYALTRRMARLR